MFYHSLVSVGPRKLKVGSHMVAAMESSKHSDCVCYIGLQSVCSVAESQRWAVPDDR